MSEELTAGDRRRLRRRRAARLREEGVWYPKWFWPSFAAPGNIWMAILFVLPFYVVLSVAMGTQDPVFHNAVPTYQPWYWNPSPFLENANKIFGATDRTISGLSIILALSLGFYAFSLMLKNREAYLLAEESATGKIARPWRVSAVAILLVLLGLYAIGDAIVSRDSRVGTGVVLEAAVLAFGILAVVCAPGVWRMAKRWRPVATYTALFGALVYTAELVNLLSKGREAIFGPAILRTFVYVIGGSIGCLLIGYPVAYYVARHSGRKKGLLLVLLIAPFWISYLMRMLAWVNILQPDGYMNKLLIFTRILPHGYGWLEGHGITVVMGLVYGYVPYMILPLYAGLDRIDQSLLEASKDLGASGPRTFLRVTLPLSKQAILAGLVINTLPMFGDYYTNNLLSQRPTTTMMGNLIDSTIGEPGRGAEGAVLVLFMSIILIVPMLYYIRETNKETESP